MPSLGADMEAGTLVEWLVRPGDEVKRGQVVAVVETQKGAVDVEIWETGTVDQILVESGRKVPVGELLALLRTAGEPVAGAQDISGLQEAAGVEAASVLSGASPSRAGIPPVPGISPVRPRVSPSARKLAEELGVEIASLQAAEPGTEISRADIERAAQAAMKAQPAIQPASSDWQSQMRKAIAAAMARSKREIPHYYLATDIDMSAVSAWLL